jgi:hypothetical protein
VIQDLHDECGKYGSVVAVAIPRPPDPATAAAAFGSGNYGKVCLGQLKCCALARVWVEENDP